MRVIILSCNTGEGHNSTGRAILEVLKNRGVYSEMVDALACFSKSFSNFICDWHAKLYRYAPGLWDVGYRTFEKREMGADEREMISLLLTLGKKKLKALLEGGDYDAIICTHVFSGMMVTELKKTWDMCPPCYFVATDYSCYPYTDCCDMDGYFIPANSVKSEYAEVGVPEERMLATGIPVRQEFYAHCDRTAAREILGLPRDATVVLLMCGSMGVGPIRKVAKKVAERLPKNAVLATFCAKNKRLYKSMQEIDDPKIRVLGFTREVSTYLDAADMIITKPGGLSITEAANKWVPMVLINSIGGCENANFYFMMNRGYAVGSSRAIDVVELAARLAVDSERRARMVEAMKKDFNCNSGEVIADIVMEAAAKHRERKNLSVAGV